MKFGAGAAEETVKKLITDVINKLQREASSEAKAGENPFPKVKEFDHGLDQQVAVRGQPQVFLR